MLHPVTDLLRRSYRTDLAHRHVTAISQFHRIQASPGYRAAANYVAEQLAAEGLATVIRRYPADARQCYWGSPSFLEWDCEYASLQLLDDDDKPVEILCDFSATAISLIQRSIAVEGKFEVVAPGGNGGKDELDYDGLEVKGKLVLTRAPVAQVHRLAVQQRGAAGLLFDGMGMGGRSELDLPDARQYTSFWWGGCVEPDGWGFVLSPRQGRRMRNLLSEGKTVRLRAIIESHFYAGAFEIVEAHIPGQSEAREEILLVSHLCHPRPGAHDNGSGAAALMESAATLARLIAEGSLPPPKRGIRFLWLPEMTGTYAWCAEHEAEICAGRWIAGLNLDMVGADQCQTGSVWQVVDTPLAAASFADHLLEWLREPLLEGQRHTETPFSAGSDHYILSDPSVGIPTPMLGQWPDRFYHTSADTPDKVSPESLGLSGTLAATYACWLANAGAIEAQQLGHWMITRFAEQAGRDAVETSQRLSAVPETGEAQRARLLTDYRRRGVFRQERMLAAMKTLASLAPEPLAELTDGDQAIHEIMTRERLWVEAKAAPTLWSRAQHGWEPGVTEEPAAAGTPEMPWMAEAGRLTPQRIHRGPIPVSLALQSEAEALLPELWAMSEEYGDDFYDITALAEYWTDGTRSIAGIADLVSLEIGRPVDDLPLRYLRLLAKAGLVRLQERTPSAHEPG